MSFFSDFYDLRPNKYIIALIIIILSGMIFMTYYLFLFKPSQEVIREQIIKEYISKLKTKAVIFDNTVSQYIQGSRSMSSRSMIRNKIADFYLGELSFEQLRDYTFPKYREGVEALECFVYARREIKNNVLVETGDKDIYMLHPAKVDTCCTSTTLYYFNTDKLSIMYVISPIKKNGELLGHDVIYYNNEKVLKEISEPTVQLEILKLSDLNKHNNIGSFLSLNNGLVSYLIKSEHSKIYLKFSSSEKNMFSDYQIFLKEQIITISLLILLILFIVSTIYKRDKFMYMKRTFEQEKKYRWMMERSNEAIVIRQNGKFIFANDASAILLGYSVDNLLKIDGKKFLPEKEKEKVRKIIEENERSGNLNYQYEVELRKKDGSIIITHISENVGDFNGLKAYFCIIRDITRQKEFLEIMRTNIQQSHALGNLITMCASCHSIKDKSKDGKPWMKPADYITERLPDVQFSHGICPECAAKLYPEVNRRKLKEDTDNLV